MLMQRYESFWASAEVRNAQQITTLRNITDHIHTLDIDPDLKRTMTEACLKIMENELMARRLNIELTQNDLVFVLKLEKKHPNLSPRDLRICLYTKLGYYTTEMAGFCKIGKRGMESVRYRIHRMLGIGPSESIKSYLTALSLE